MKSLFSIKDLRDIAKKEGASFFRDSGDTIRIVYKVGRLDYTETYFGSDEKGFRKHYN